MRKLFIAVFMFVSSFGSNVMADGHAIKMGIILGFTGPIESLTPAMAASAELAFKEASDSGSLLGGKKIEPGCFNSCIIFNRIYASFFAVPTVFYTSKWSRR